MTAPLVFDKYEVLRRLATGGMGEIFLARQRGIAGFDRLAILKTLLPELADDREFLDQFLDEARVAATLSHPNIVSIYEVGQFQDVYFIAMEYIDGADLALLIRTAVKTEKPVPVRVCVSLARGAAFGLDHAHHARDPQGRPLEIVHRDISPQNLMVRSDGVVKVVDFGVARAVNRASHTQGNVVKGKLAYMSPEHVSAMPVDGRSDQFALGVVLWEFLARRRMFRGETPFEIGKAIMAGNYPPPSTFAPEVPPELDHVVMRMMAPRADDRYPRCLDAAEALQGFLDATGGSAYTETARAIQDVLGAHLARAGENLTPMPVSIQGLTESAGSVCPNCGARVAGRIRFCGDCGTRLDAPPGGTSFTPGTGNTPLGAFAPGSRQTPQRSVGVRQEVSTEMLLRPEATQLMVAEPDVYTVVTGTPLPSAPFDDHSAGNLSLPTTFRADNRGATDGTPTGQRVPGLGPPPLPTGAAEEFPHGAAAPVPVPADGGTGAGAQRPTLRGRAREVAAIQAVLEGALQGTCGGLVLLGGAGTGRSRLLEEAEGLAWRLGLRVLRARAGRFSVPVALDVVRQLLASTDGLTTSAPVDPDARPRRDVRHKLQHLASLGVQTPTLRRVRQLLDGTQLAPREEPLEQRMEAEGALVQTLLLLSQERPLALLVDDLHKADPDSVALLQNLLVRMGPSRVALIAAASPDLPEKVLAQFPRASLAPLSNDDVRLMAEEHLRGSVHPALLAHLCAASRGAPSLVRMKLRHVLAQSLVKQHGTEWRLDDLKGQTLPDSPADLTVAALRRLGPDALKVLTAAALQGDEFVLPVVGAALGTEVAEATVAELVAQGLVRRLGRGGELMQFAQGGTRDAVMAQIPPADLKPLRAAVARAMSKDPAAAGADVVEAVARMMLLDHAEQGAMHAANAADRLATEGAFALAADLYRKALASAVRTPVGQAPNARAASALYRLATRAVRCVAQVDPGAAAAMVGQLVDHLPAPPSPAESVELQRQGALALLVSGKLDDADQAMTRALQQLPADGAVELRAELTADLARVQDARQDLPRALELMLACFHMMDGRPSENPDFYWEQLLRMGRLHLRGHQVAAAEQSFNNAVDQARLAGSITGEVRALLQQALCREALHHLEEALPLLGEAETLAASSSLNLDLSRAYLAHGRMEQLLGHQETATLLLQQAASVAVMLGWSRGAQAAHDLLESGVNARPPASRGPA